MKKITSMLTIILILFSMTGFSPVQEEFFKESQRVNNWSASETTGAISFSYSDPAGNHEYGADYKVLSNLKSMTSEMQFSNFKFPSGKTYPAVKIIYDNNTVYYDLNAAVIVAGEAMKEDISKYVEVKNSYLGYTVDLEKLVNSPMYQDMFGADYLMKLSNNPQALLETYNKYIESNPEMDLEIKMSGNTYTIDSNLYQLAKVGQSMIQGMSDASAMDMADFDANIDLIKEDLETVTFKYEVTFAPSSYKGSMAINGLFMSDQVNLNMSFNGVEKSGATIKAPDSYIKINLNEIIKAAEATMPMYPVDPAEEEKAVSTDEATKPYLSIKLDGKYMIDGKTGRLDMKNIYGNVYVRRIEMEKLLNIRIPSSQEYVYIKMIDNADYTFYTEWNPATNAIEVYKY